MRITGPRAGAALRALAGPLPEPRRASLRRLRDPTTGETLDRGLVLWFPGPHSATGEDLAELHPHGAPAVLEALLTALARLPGLVPAGPGAFTRRAFDRDRLDLTEIEALADLMAAETQAQRRQAVGAAGFGRQAEAWRLELLDLRASVEAALDFADEDLPPDLLDGAQSRAAMLAALLAAHLDPERRGERLRDGFRVVLAGPPNVGKSSLLNALVGRDAAIVTDQPGTTRDVLEAHLDLGGWPVTLLDTAGLRETDEAIEAEGIRRARAAAAEADLVLDLHAGDDPPSAPAAGHLAVWTKADLRPGRVAPAPSLSVSAATGTGLAALRAVLEGAARQALGGVAPVLIRARHRAALSQAILSLETAAAEADPVLLAEHLRAAAAALGQITGRTGVEDMLDRLFAGFCIGK